MGPTYKPIICSSLLSFEDEGDSGTFKHSYNNFALKQGVVIKCHEIDSDSNLNNLGPEYDVVVTEQDENRGTTSTIYRNCSSIDSFGGVGDFLETKFRAATEEKYKTEQDPTKTNGAIVIMLCLDGVSKKGIIIGAVKHSKRKSNLTKDNGHHLEGEFNGLNWKVDKDGALTITFKSATDNEGKPQDDAAGGSFATITKEGSIELNDGNTEKILIDKTAKTIDLEAEKDISATTKANLNVKAEKSINLTAKKDLIAMAEGKAAFTIKSTLDIKADAPMMIMTPQLQINATNGMLVMGSQVIVQAPLVSLGPSPAPALITNTQFQGIGNLGAPVISLPIGPFSKSVQVST